jgi:hypothetical protein
MAIQFSTTLRNARANSIETTIGSAPVVKIRTGSPPASCASTDTGTQLLSYTLASDWLVAASSGIVTFQNMPITSVASSSGTAGHYRLYGPAGSTCHMQGTVGVTTSTADMLIDTASVAAAQVVSILSWSITEGNS